MQERFKVLSKKELVKNMMYLVCELNPRLSVHEADTLPSELKGFYICQAGLGSLSQHWGTLGKSFTTLWNFLTTLGNLFTTLGNF